MKARIIFSLLLWNAAVYGAAPLLIQHGEQLAKATEYKKGIIAGRNMTDEEYLKDYVGYGNEVKQDKLAVQHAQTKAALKELAPHYKKTAFAMVDK